MLHCHLPYWQLPHLQHNYVHCSALFSNKCWSIETLDALETILIMYVQDTLGSGGTMLQSSVLGLWELKDALQHALANDHTQ